MKITMAVLIIEVSSSRFLTVLIDTSLLATCLVSAPHGFLRGVHEPDQIVHCLLIHDDDLNRDGYRGHRLDLNPITVTVPSSGRMAQLR